MRSIFDYILVETVGVGQSEVFIKDITDTVVLCVQPGGGDTIQFMKSGIFEIPDIVLVTKSDMESISNITFADLKASQSYFENKNQGNIEIIKVSSHKNFGFDNLYNSTVNRWKLLKEKEIIFRSRKEQDLKWIERSIIDEFGINGKVKSNKLMQLKKNPFKQLQKIREFLNK